MSFILEALKKSENARQRQSGPGFAGLPEKTQARKNVIWPWVIGALLLVNAVIIGVVLLRDGPGPSPVSAPSLPAPAETGTTAPPSGLERDKAASPAARSSAMQQLPAATAPPEPAVRPEITTQAPSVEPGDTRVRSLADEARSPSQATMSDATVSSGPASRPGLENPATEAPAVQRSEPEPPAQAAQPDLPDVQELYLSGELSGAPINLDLHVYFPESSRRVVFISGKRYREGDEVDAGLTVEEIIPAGVILGRRGRNYLLQAN
ncbi:MAG: general secretion pathway protein GspB [Gammaproteobacteria bacterium]|jgi:general secretion pathway protein B